MELFKNKMCSIGQFMANFLRNYYLSAAMLAGFSLLVVAPQSMADEVEATLIQSISTSNFPSPDTSGIFYLHSQNAFLITDSEINEMPIFQGFNVFKVDRNGGLLGSFSTMAFSEEPTGITVNPTNNHCFFSDDNNGVKSVFEIDPGEDDICLTSDDGITTSFYTPNHTDSLRADPEDVSYGLSSLFIADGSNDRVYRVKPGNNGLFDGEPSLGGDDLVSGFDTTSIGLADPEGIAFDSSNNTLFIVGQPRDLIFQTTINGVLLRTIDISSIHPLNPAGLALAPSSEDPAITNLYLVARGIDNDDPNYPNENDGMIYELSLPAITVENQAPIVSAGADQWFIFPSTAQLIGSASDDDRPSSTFMSTWSQQSGPGVVSFTEPNNLNTTASFSMEGTYILRLTVDDGDLTNFDELTIIATSYPSSPGIRNVPSDYPTIKDAFSNAVPGDTIVLAPGTYQMSETLEINKNDISIVSNYVKSGDPSDIDSTIINGDGTKSFIQGILDQSANLKLIGLTITNFDKGVTFTDNYGEVHYCKFNTTLSDAISFDNNAGGAVTHTRVENAGDDAIDIDTRYNGSFLIAYNELINSGDDSIEIHLFNSISPLNMHHDIHDNLFSGAGEDGIQLIDFDIDSNRTFDIYRNTFIGMPDVAIGTMHKETRENFEGAAMVERVRIYNNYFYNNGYHITGGDNMIILNNVFEQAKIAAIKRVKGDSITDYNLFYNNPINTVDTVTGGNNILEIDPQSNIDLTLQPASPAIDAGIASYTHLSELVLEMPTIKYGGQNPDLGRYEYNLANPVLTLLGANPISLNINDNFSDPGATALDNQDENLTAAINTISDVDTAIAASYTVTYNVTDPDGNSSSLSRMVIVRDNTIAPVITLIGDNTLHLNLDDNFSDPGATAWDKEDEDLTPAIITISDVNNAVAGSYQVTYTVTDSDKNSVSATRSVIVRDNTIAPVITLLGANPLQINLGEIFVDPGATATDDIDGDITDAIVRSSNLNTTIAGSYQITYTVIDSDKNSFSATRSVIVRDNTIAPVITLIGDNPLHLNLDDNFSDSGATAWDKEDEDLTPAIITISDVDTAVVGSYQVTYTVTDSDKNSVSATRSVIVRDNTIAPVITLLGANPLQINLGEIFVDPGATATDDIDGNLTDDIIPISDVDTAVVGSYQVTYTVTDSDKNSVSAIRSVIIRDNTIAPVITLIGDNPLHLNLDDNFSDPGATAWDKEDENLTAAIKTISDVDTAVAGSYQITYTVADSDENVTSVSRTVILSAETDSPKSDDGTSSTSAGGGSTNRTLLLILALVFFFRYSRKGQLL